MTLAAHNLSVTVPGRALIAGLSVQFNPRENWAVLGANGSGKSLLLHTLAGIRASRESVRLDGRLLENHSSRERARSISLLLQESEAAAGATALEMVLGGRYAQLPAWRWETQQDVERAEAALEAVGLGGFGQRLLETLSGGERRRCAIAAMLTQKTRVALWDEPTNHLDLHYQMDILQRLGGEAESQGIVNVFVLHDVNLARRFCSHALLLFGDGRWEAGAIDETVNEGSLSALYGCAIRRVREEEGFYFPR